MADSTPQEKKLRLQSYRFRGNFTDVNNENFLPRMRSDQTSFYGETTHKYLVYKGLFFGKFTIHSYGFVANEFFGYCNFNGYFLGTIS